ncbi:MAG: Alpha/Beta hydrolase protein [Monoraphidium minutum]|nr:MAG: Alpha/Beta hydrolase protein [Monoraphidium minutum]
MATGGMAARPARRAHVNRCTAALLLAIALLLLLLSPPPAAARGSGHHLLKAPGVAAPAARKAKANAANVKATFRQSMAGAARGRKAAGQPDPVKGLVQPDRPMARDRTATMEDLVLPYGYPLESYPVETPDGFILRLYRIPHGKSAAPPGPGRPVVILHHGITLTSACFVSLEPESSMGFYLADAGFDVWMVNTRGNTFSAGHRRLHTSDNAYWEFSMDEQAVVDLPLLVDAILATSGKKRAALIGHSQGCTLALMMLAAKPDYNDKLWLLMMMGSVTNPDDVSTPFLRQQARTFSATVLQQAGIGSLFSHPGTAALSAGCGKSDKSAEWCAALIFFTFYGSSRAISPYDIERIGATWPTAVGTRTMLHWSQMLGDYSGLGMYDFGAKCPAGPKPPPPFQETCNQAKYGQAGQPYYDISKVTAKAAVLHGLSDVMATDKGRARMLGSWSADVVVRKEYPDTAHMDFVWARRPVMKDDIIKILWDNAPHKR